MLYQNIPADEICVHACAIFLNIHIIIDYLHGCWTTLDIPDLNHDLAISLSEVHMAYCGLCKYSYLCHTIDLPTKGKKILKHKLEKIRLLTTKHLKIKLTRVEEFNNTAAILLNTTSRILRNTTPTSHESHTHFSKELNINNLNKNKSSRKEPISLFNTETSDTRNTAPLVLKKVTPESNLNKLNMNKENTVKPVKEARIKLHRVDDKIHFGKSINTEMNETNDSDDTVIYSMEEKLIGTIWTLDSENEKKKPKKEEKEQKLTRNKKTTTPNMIMLFKCPIKGFNIRKENRKKINEHYKQKHKRRFKCDKCDRRYTILHSLKQHLYNHCMNKKFICVKCNTKFAFMSQLKLHQLIHTWKYKHRCEEYSNTYKYKHNMLKHKRQHTADEEKCELCDYTGNKINLKAHRCQHFKKYHVKCQLCQRLFVHRMSLWRHKQECKRSSSPEY